MDLGCLDMGCLSVSDKHHTESFTTDSSTSNKENEANEPVMENSRFGKNKSPKGNNQPQWNALNKCTSQIKKPRHRNDSPINWFPRKKVDSYLKRKIKMLQEVDGMNLTLDETLGDTNPHYCRVLREKMAAKEAAQKAMEARKAALVEASWSRILKAARIQSKEAEALLSESEKAATEAFEAAGAMGVIMYDKPNCHQTHYQVETSYANGGGSTTHTITASFDTAFEVDKEVATAVKTAFVRLANYPPFSKDEFKDLLHTISENPDTSDNNQKLPDFSSECKSGSGPEHEALTEKNGCGTQGLISKNLVGRQNKSKRRKSPEKVKRANLVDMMLERLRRLQEDELSSLATIVATCGLNAVLAEVENSKMPYTISNFQRMSSVGAGSEKNANLENLVNGSVRKKQIESELPSLDKFLVKHMSKLEQEVQEARSSRMHESSKAINGENHGKPEIGEVKVDLGSDFLKHSLKFAKEREEAKISGNDFNTVCKNSGAGALNEEVICSKKDVPEVPSLDKFLLKHVSRLEREVQEAKNTRNNDSVEETKKKIEAFEVPSLDKFLLKHVSRLEKEVQEAKNRRDDGPVAGSRGPTDLKKNVVSQHEKIITSFFDSAGEDEKENVDLSKGDGRISVVERKNTKSLTEDAVDGLDKILVKPVHRLEREKIQALSVRNNYRNHRYQKNYGRDNVTECDSLDKVLVKHISRLEKEKMKFKASEEAMEAKRNGINMYSHSQKEEECSLDQVLVKHKSRLEREKMAAAAVQKPAEEVIARHSLSRREARERELQEAWGGLSLGNSIKPHLSRLERDKADWIKAEESERRQAMEGM